MKKLFLIILYFAIAWICPAQTPRITLVSIPVAGSGSYFEPYIIRSTTIRWRVDQSTCTSAAQLASEIHMNLHRSCSNVLFPVFESWPSVVNKVFSHTNICGQYYLKLTIQQGASSVSTETYFYLEIPPVNRPFVEPYAPPAGNLPPISRTQFINVSGGDGSWGNRYQINCPVIHFRLDTATDPNGADDLKYGVRYWAIYMGDKIAHPKYSSARDDEMDPAATYLYDANIHGELTWDTRERPSSDNRYDFIQVVIDQHGVKCAETWVYLQVNPTTPCQPSDPRPPSAPSNLKFKK
jgi:hypothetical protein